MSPGSGSRIRPPEQLSNRPLDRRLVAGVEAPGPAPGSQTKPNPSTDGAETQTLPEPGGKQEAEPFGGPDGGEVADDQELRAFTRILDEEVGPTPEDDRLLLEVHGFGPVDRPEDLGASGELADQRGRLRHPRHRPFAEPARRGGILEPTGPLGDPFQSSCFEALGIAKIGRDGVDRELQGGSADDESPGPGLSSDQARQVLDFAEAGRGGPEVLDQAERAIGSSAKAAEGIANLRAIVGLLEAAGVPPERVQIDLGLARGLDYYTGVVFETTVDGFEKFGSVASGGRYDNLTRLFTDQALPGVGASIGLDRLLSLLEESGWGKGASTMVPVLFPNFPGADARHAVRLAARLRAAGIGAEVYPDPIQAGKQLQYGSTRGHRLAVIVGPAEQEAETFNLRDLATREERKGLPWTSLEAEVALALGFDPGAAR